MPALSCVVYGLSGFDGSACEDCLDYFWGPGCDVCPGSAHVACVRRMGVRVVRGVSCEQYCVRSASKRASGDTVFLCAGAGSKTDRSQPLNIACNDVNDFLVFTPMLYKLSSPASVTDFAAFDITSADAIEAVASACSSKCADDTSCPCRSACGTM